MNRQIIGLFYGIFVLPLLVISSGCQLVDAYIPGYTTWTATAAKEAQELEQEHRKRFQLEGDPESIRWLKANRLKQGMPLGDVNQILGMDGTPVSDRRRFIEKNSLYQNSDRLYKWGPDSRGNSHFLVFRNDRLVNYDPKEFQED